MPYIAKNEREILLEGLIDPANPGQVNYLITYAVDKYITQQGLSYTSINEMIGVLECAKLELYRRVAFYEDKKMEENGDVYSPELVRGFE